MTQKSKESFLALEPIALNCKQAILWKLSFEALRTDELIELLPKYKSATVVGRISDLYDEGLICPSNEFENETSYTLWRLTSLKEIEGVKNIRRFENYLRWLNKSEEFSDIIPSEIMRWIQLTAKPSLQ